MTVTNIISKTTNRNSLSPELCPFPLQKQIKTISLDVLGTRKKTTVVDGRISENINTIKNTKFLKTQHFNMDEKNIGGKRDMSINTRIGKSRQSSIANPV